MQSNEQFQEPTPEEIANLAYAIWEHEGCPQGQDVRHWLDARALLIEIKCSPAAKLPSSAGEPEVANGSAPQGIKSLEKKPGVSIAKTHEKTTARATECPAIIRA